MRVAILAVLPLAGCTMSAAGLHRSDVEMTLTSSKTAQEWATCSGETMGGQVQIRNQGDHYWVLRVNGYGAPTARWDFTPTANGSKAELRSSIPLNTGDERVKNCA